MRHERITSPQNERVKTWVRLQRDGIERQQRGEFLVEGRKLVKTALESGKVRTFLYSSAIPRDDELVRLAESHGTELVELSAAVFRKVADVKTPQGVAAVVELPQWDESRIFGRDAFILVACGIQEPGNLGSMMRSACAAGATGFVSLRPSADIFHPRSVRGSAGAVMLLPSIRMEAEEFLERSQEAGLRLLAAFPRGGVDFRACDYSRPVGIVVGSEAHGVDEAIARAASAVTIPMVEKIESLNAAAAAALLLFEAARHV